MSAGSSVRGLPTRSLTRSTSISVRHLPNLVANLPVRPEASKPQTSRCICFRSTQVKCFTTHEKQNASAKISHHELSLEDEMLAAQDAAIAELAAKLGKPLQQAIEEDKLADRLLEGTKYDPNAKEQDVAVVEEIESPIAILRASGVSPEVVAGEARNIFGDYLPDDVLSTKELKIYKRLYGEPLPEPEGEPEELIDDADGVGVQQVPGHVLLDPAGQEVSYRLENVRDIQRSMNGSTSGGARPDQSNDSEKAVGETYNPIEIEEVARAVGGDLVDEEDYDFDAEEDGDTRSHALTSLGRFGTSPRTAFLPKDTFVKPIDEVMSKYSNKQLKEQCEKTFGGLGLPDSPLTPRSGRARPQIAIPLDASQHNMGQMEANAFITTVMPPTYASILATLAETRKRLGSTWLTNLLSRPGGPRILDAGSGGVGILAWRDITKAHWDSLHTSDKGPPPAPESKNVVLTGSDTLRHRAAAMLENTTFVPRLPDIANTRQTPTMDDDRPAQKRKQFDVIISSHSLFPLKEEWERKHHVQNLWAQLSDAGGVVIFLEKGIPRGFETVAAARDLLLERYIATPEGHVQHYSNSTTELNAPESETEVYQKTPGMIVAPCTNHDRCPLYKTSGLSKGRKDICSFQQRYIRPPFLQRVLGANDRNHDDVDFSYVAVMKGEDLRTRSLTTWEHIADPLSAPRADPSTTQSKTPSISPTNLLKRLKQEIQAGYEHHDPDWFPSTSSTTPSKSDILTPPPLHTLPRILNPPLKRRGHVTIDLCTPTAEILRWTIPKSFSRQAYRDARKARWGDLWALGAKTSVPRNLKLGMPAKELGKSGADLTGAGVGRRAKLERQATKILQDEEQRKDEEEMEKEELQRLFDEDDLLDEADDDDDLINMDDLVPLSSKKEKKKGHNHAKLDGVNIFAQKNPALNSFSPRFQGQGQGKAKAKQPQSKSQSQSSTPADKKTSDVFEYPPTGRYGSKEDENLSAWSEELNDALLEDEVRKGVMKKGSRPTSKNTGRLKRDLRRVKREQGS